MSDSGDKTRVGLFLQRHAEGESTALAGLFRFAEGRLRELIQQIVGSNNPLWSVEQTDDVLQAVYVRLFKALADYHPESTVHFFRLASQHIRYAMWDFCRVHFGSNRPKRVSSHSGSGSLSSFADPHLDNPESLLAWSGFHECVEKLPEDLRDVVDARWYFGQTIKESAEALGISIDQVNNRWRQAKIQLYRLLSDFDERASDDG